MWAITVNIEILLILLQRLYFATESYLSTHQHSCVMISLCVRTQICTSDYMTDVWAFFCNLDIAVRLCVTSIYCESLRVAWCLRGIHQIYKLLLIFIHFRRRFFSFYKFVFIYFSCFCVLRGSGFFWYRKTGFFFWQSFFDSWCSHKQVTQDLMRF